MIYIYTCEIIIAEWSQSQLSIRGQPRTFAFGGQERKHAMCLLFATIQRQSKHGIEGKQKLFVLYALKEGFKTNGFVD